MEKVLSHPSVFFLIEKIDPSESTFLTMKIFGSSPKISYFRM